MCADSVAMPELTTCLYLKEKKKVIIDEENIKFIRAMSCWNLESSFNFPSIQNV